MNDKNTNLVFTTWVKSSPLLETYYLLNLNDDVIACLNFHKMTLWTSVYMDTYPNPLQFQQSSKIIIPTGMTLDVAKNWAEEKLIKFGYKRVPFKLRNLI